MEEQLAATVGRLTDSANVQITDFEQIPGGFSRETFRFDAHCEGAEGSTLVPLILRKDPPHSVAILHTSRAVEHDLIEAIRTHTTVPVTQSLGAIMDADVFGQPAMLLERAPGNNATSDLFNDGPDVAQVDDVVRHLCEALVALHEADVVSLDVGGALRDPRGVGIDASSWDAYMNSTFEYYLGAYDDMAFDPSMSILLDASLTLRRDKPRAMPLSVIHGDFNPANFLYADGEVTALIDWENARIGDPREDLGWMVTMDGLSNTDVMSHPLDEGGFLEYYNKLRGLDITEEELGYFTLFGTMNIAVPVNSAIKRRTDGENQEFLHLYLVQSSVPALLSLGQLLGYPGLDS